MSEPEDCSTCKGTGLYAKKRWDSPEIQCDDCMGTGNWHIAECLRLILETDRLIGKSNPKLARDVKAALEERIKEKT